MRRLRCSGYSDGERRTRGGVSGEFTTHWSSIFGLFSSSVGHEKRKKDVNICMSKTDENQ